jgi:CBS domain-containing protein
MRTHAWNVVVVTESGRPRFPGSLGGGHGFQANRATGVGRVLAHKAKGMTMQAQDVMTTWVATIGAGATVREAARLMAERKVSALPVLDDEDRMIGIVSEGDLVRRAELGTETAGSWWLVALAKDAAADYRRTHGVTVSDVMTHPVLSVAPTASLREVAQLMEKHRIKRLPVLDAGRLAGIVSRADLVRSLAK